MTVLHTTILLMSLFMQSFAPAEVAPTSPGILLTVSEAQLGDWMFEWDGTVSVDVAPGTPLNFSWLADGEPHGVIITGYRYGWDVQDINDSADPGWMIPWTEDALSSPTQIFNVGTHSFAVLVKDDIGRETQAIVNIRSLASLSGKADYCIPCPILLFTLSKIPTSEASEFVVKGADETTVDFVTLFEPGAGYELTLAMIPPLPLVWCSLLNEEGRQVGELSGVFGAEDIVIDFSCWHADASEEISWGSIKARY